MALKAHTLVHSNVLRKGGHYACTRVSAIHRRLNCKTLAAAVSSRVRVNPEQDRQLILEKFNLRRVATEDLVKRAALLGEA